MKRTKLSPKLWAALTVFSLVGQIAWVVENMYFNVLIYKMFHASAAAISTMVAASAVAATLTTILIGALSDKLGKRKLFICGGYILWGISIWSFALIRADVIGRLFPAAGGPPRLRTAAFFPLIITGFRGKVHSFFAGGPPSSGKARRPGKTGANAQLSAENAQPSGEKKLTFCTSCTKIQRSGNAPGSV